jgi:hypothetical protein
MLPKPIHANWGAIFALAVGDGKKTTIEWDFGGRIIYSTVRSSIERKPSRVYRHTSSWTMSDSDHRNYVTSAGRADQIRIASVFADLECDVGSVGFLTIFTIHIRRARSSWAPQIKNHYQREAAGTKAKANPFSLVRFSKPGIFLAEVTTQLQNCGLQWPLRAAVYTHLLTIYPGTPRDVSASVGTAGTRCRLFAKIPNSRSSFDAHLP